MNHYTFSLEIEHRQPGDKMLFSKTILPVGSRSEIGSNEVLGFFVPGNRCVGEWRRVTLEFAVDGISMGDRIWENTSNVKRKPHQLGPFNKDAQTTVSLNFRFNKGSKAAYLLANDGKKELKGRKPTKRECLDACSKIMADQKPSH